MNDDLLKGKWKQLKGELKNKWGKLTDDDIQQIEGNREKLIGKIQEKYGKDKEEAKKEFNDWIDSQ
ncbi:MAG: CsbD family protein [Bacillota bacterium]